MRRKKRKKVRPDVNLRSINKATFSAQNHRVNLLSVHCAIGMIRVLCRSQIKTRLLINTVSVFRWHLLKASRTFWNQSEWVIDQSVLGTVPSKKWKKKKDENITTKGNTRVTYKCIYQHMITYKYPITFFFLRSTNVRAPYDVVASDLHCSVTKVWVRATYASIWKEEESSFQSNVMIFRSERFFWWKLIFDITLFVSKYSYVWGRTKPL